MRDRTDYYRAYYLETLALRGKEPRHDAGPVRAHVEHLQALGMLRRHISDAAGIHPKTVDAIAAGQPAVSAHVAHAVLAVRPPATVIGLTRRVQALAALGWSMPAIAAAAGLSRGAIKHYREGGLRTITDAALDGILRAYSSLSMRAPAPSDASERAQVRRTRNIAARHGWAPPLAWDDDTIDDPAATPALDHGDGPDVDPIAVQRAIDGDRVDLNADERLEVIRVLAARGMSDTEIAARAGIDPRSVQRRRRYHGIRSEWRDAS